VLGVTNDTTPTPPNNSLGGLLPHKLMIDVLKAMEYDNRCVVSIIDFTHFYDYCV